MNFWKELQQNNNDDPFFCLAPMEDVTDIAFRQMFAKYGTPDVMWGEFISADGIVFADEEGLRKIHIKTDFKENERPAVAQIFTAVPERAKKAAQFLAKKGFDGIDINMGCPDRGVEKGGAGAALIKNTELAVKIIEATKEGSGGIPISVKTRAGYASADELEKWITTLLKTEISALTIHARTRKQLSKVDADWDLIKQAVTIRDNLKVDTLIIGNGDVKNLTDGIQKAKETGCDGIMVGRGVFGNPLFFTGKKPTQKQTIKLLIEHIKLFDKNLFSTNTKSFGVMKKHFKAYISGWDGAKELRSKLMDTKSPQEAIDILQSNI